VALEDRCACGVLVTLGGCRHLDDFEQRGALARVGDCSWLSLDDCEGFLCLLRWSSKGNFSKLLVLLSYLTCG